MTTSTGIKLSDKVTDMATRLKTSFTLGDDGIVNAAADTFEKTLEGTELTMDTVRKVQEHTANVTAGAGLALGEIAIDAMKANPELGMLSVEFSIGKDTLGSTFLRSKEVPDGQGGMQNKTGLLSSRYVVNAGANRGELKKVRTHLHEQAKAALSE